MKRIKNDKSIKNIFEVISKIDDKKNAEKFFVDLCTPEELRAMSERFQIARLLNQGFSYRKIAEETGTSTTTVSRVANCFNNGEGGYALAMKKINSNHHNSSKTFRKS